MDEDLARVGKCGHALECRGLACRIELVIPGSFAQQRQPGGGGCFEPESRLRLGERVTFIRETGEGSAFDPISRTWLRKVSLYLRLFDEAASTVQGDRLKPQLPPGWDRDRGAVPEGLDPDCRARALRVRKEIEDLVHQVQRDFPPLDLFASSAPNATLSREISDVLRPCLAPEGPARRCAGNCLPNGEA